MNPFRGGESADGPRGEGGEGREGKKALSLA